MQLSIQKHRNTDLSDVYKSNARVFFSKQWFVSKLKHQQMIDDKPRKRFCNVDIIHVQIRKHVVAKVGFGSEFR